MFPSNKRVIEYEFFVKPQPHCKTKESQHHYIKILVFTLAEPQLLLHSARNLFPLEAGNPQKLSAPTQGPQLHPSLRIFFFLLWTVCRIYNQLSSSCTGHRVAFSSESFPSIWGNTYKCWFEVRPVIYSIRHIWISPLAPAPAGHCSAPQTAFFNSCYTDLGCSSAPLKFISFQGNLQPCFPLSASTPALAEKGHFCLLALALCLPSSVCISHELLWEDLNRAAILSCRRVSFLLKLRYKAISSATFTLQSPHRQFLGIILQTGSLNQCSAFSIIIHSYRSSCQHLWVLSLLQMSFVIKGISQAPQSCIHGCDCFY